MVKVTPQLVTSRSSWLTHLLTLGSYSRNVAIDSRAKTVRIDVRYLWTRHKRETIPFNQIAYITYEMQESGGTSAYFTGEREGYESFDIGLGLKTGKRVHLAQFSGEGEYVSDHAFFWQWPSHKLAS